MFRFLPSTMDELRERAASSRPSTATQAMAESPRPRPRNVQAVLDLGTLAYFHWRGRNFGVPPLPWKAGAELLDAWLEVQGYGEMITRETHAGYYAALHRMSRIMWRCTRTVGVVPRFFRRIGLMRNPYRNATEGELIELALFFLGRRTIGHGLRVDPMPNSQTT